MGSMAPAGAGAPDSRSRTTVRHVRRGGVLLAALAALGAAAAPGAQPLPAEVSAASAAVAADVPAAATAVRPRRANAVAIPDILVRREHREFFYDERLDASASVQGHRRASTDVGFAGSSESTLDARSDVSYSRRMGTVRTVSYAELRGLLADVRATLRSAGYEVVQARPANTPVDPSKGLPSLRERIAAGDFGDAAWVLGVEIVDTSVRPTRERIDGTNDFSNRLEVGLTAEFTLVDTASLAVAMAFNAHGQGADMHLGKATAPFVPDQARIVRDLLASFGEDARRKILRNLPNPASPGAVIAGAADANRAASRGSGDPATLRVYREPDPATDGAGGATGRAAGAVRVFRN